jgi:hypothetical protein
MALCDLPIEILFCIGDYLDYRSILKLRRANHFFDFVFNYVTKVRLRSFLNECDIKNVDLSDLTEISTKILINMLFFIRKHASYNLPRMLTINVTNTFLKCRDYRTYKTLEKYIFLVSNELFSQIQFNRLEKELLRTIICNKRFFVMRSNIPNNLTNNLNEQDTLNNDLSISTITFFRTDYNVLYENLFSNVSSAKDDKYMVTFHFFT